MTGPGEERVFHNALVLRVFLQYVTINALSLYIPAVNADGMRCVMKIVIANSWHLGFSVQWVSIIRFWQIVHRGGWKHPLY